MVVSSSKRQKNLPRAKKYPLCSLSTRHLVTLGSWRGLSEKIQWRLLYFQNFRCLDNSCCYCLLKLFIPDSMRNYKIVHLCFLKLCSGNRKKKMFHTYIHFFHIENQMIDDALVLNLRKVHIPKLCDIVLQSIVQLYSLE